MGINEVAKKFLLLSGIDESELSKYLPLIRESIAYVKSILKEEVDVEVDVKENSTLLTSACGTYAYYKWSLFYSQSDVSYFKAGDLTVSKSSESKVTQRAYSLWKESLKEIARFTKSSDFYFKGVSV